MKCPYCQSEMERGKLKSRGGMFFLPDGETMPKLYINAEFEKHRAISFPPHLLDIKLEYPTAYVCRTCGKIIMDFHSA